MCLLTFEWKIRAFRIRLKFEFLRRKEDTLSAIKRGTSAFRIVYLLVKIEVISAFKFKRGCFGGFSIRAVPLNFSASACDLFRHWRPRNRLRGRGNWQFAVANDERFKIIIVGSIILSNCNLFYYLVTPIVLVQYIFYFVVEILRNSILKM